jgi:type II secretory pathway pseudopilin PulG
MSFFACRRCGFSLIEVTLALGIAAFCLLAVFGLMPIAVQTNRNATSQTAATNIIASVIADMRATTSSRSPQYGITLGTNVTRYFDSTGQCACDNAGLRRFNSGTGSCSDTWNPALQLRYRLDVTFSQQNPTPTPPAIPTIYADLKMTWPAAATTANANRSAEMLVAFDRN